MLKFIGLVSIFAGFGWVLAIIGGFLFYKMPELHSNMVWPFAIIYIITALPGIVFGFKGIGWYRDAVKKEKNEIE